MNRRALKRENRPLHPLIASQVTAGVAAADEIKAVADYLSELLVGMHGGRWDVMINHQSFFVMITRDVS